MILAAQKAISSNVNLSSIGLQKLEFKDDVELLIVRFDEGEDEFHRFWKTKLVVKRDNIVIDEKFPIMNDYTDNTNFYFVPIKRNKYILDLNEDKNFEFAIAHGHGGNAFTTETLVLSVINSRLKVYKKAWYLMEGGREVIWDKRKLPKKCMYLSENLCDTF
jgi:hypothetical protein